MMHRTETQNGPARGARVTAGQVRRILSSLRSLLVPLSIFPCVSGCAALQLGIVNHAGPVAERQWHLYLVVGSVLIFVALPVLLLTPIVAWHYRLSNKNDAVRPNWNFSWIIEGLIWIPPTGIVIALSIILWRSTHELDPYRPLASDRPVLEVQVVALDWKWLFIYPDEHVAVMNQLAIPVGQPVHLSLTSGTVMQSLMIPQLAGQIYAMAGMTNELNLAASRPGTFRGENTQFNGEGFQNQTFDVLALAPTAYEDWLTKVRTSGQPLTDSDVAQLFKSSVEPQPIYYASIPPHLFHQIHDKATEPTR
jgi:cytochrome o ubiquinol oxidase subunit 2